MKKIFSVITVIVLVFALSVTSFAYAPIVSVKSSDWKILTEHMTSCVYPNQNIITEQANKVLFEHSELNGETYYYSYNDEWDYPWVSESTFYIPALNFDNSGMAFGEPASDTIVFSSGYDIYVAFLYYGFDNVYLSSKGQLTFYLDTTTEVDIYRCSYPFTSWSYLGYFDWYDSDSYELEVNEFGIKDECKIIWSSLDINLYPDTLIHRADTTPVTSASHTMKFKEPIFAFTGDMYFKVSDSDLKFLSSGACAMRLDNFGMIVGTSCNYYTYSFVIDIWDKTTEKLIDQIIISDAQEDVFEVGDCIFDDYVIFSEFEYDETVASSNYIVELSFIYATDGQNLFFPGTFDIVEFESYEEDMEHQEIVGAISDASSVITGAISDAKTDLADEISKAATDISDSINSQTDIISDEIKKSTDSINDKLDSVGDSINDKLDDVGDSINDKLEDTKKGLLEGIKGFFIPSDDAMEDIDKQWDDLLKTRFGALYEVSDIISDFGSNLTWEYIQTAGQKNTITMPKVTVNFGITPFTFGGYEVSIIPAGFDVLVTAVKGITSIVCTFLFINSLRNKYEKLIGGSAA